MSATEDEGKTENPLRFGNEEGKSEGEDVGAQGPLRMANGDDEDVDAQGPLRMANGDDEDVDAQGPLRI